MTLAYSLDADAEQFLGVVQDFCTSRVGPRAQDIDLTGEFFPDLLADAAAIGLQGLIFTDDAPSMRPCSRWPTRRRS